MSFMFNPHPYDDKMAVNRVELSAGTIASIVSGVKETAAYLAEAAIRLTEANGGAGTIALDGYLGAQWEQTVQLIAQQLAGTGIECAIYDMADCCKSRSELDRQFAAHLPEDKEQDPVLLFGRLYREGRFEDVLDAGKLEGLVRRMQADLTPEAGRRKVVLVYGCGAAVPALRPLVDRIVYFDVTPKRAILRAKAGRVRNLGDRAPRPFKALLRRAYYVDFELAGHWRKELLQGGHIDDYVADAGVEEGDDGIQLLPRAALEEMLGALAKQPFRCKPVYIEGVWGGHYVRKLRQLPDTLRNVAWVFDLIPLEVSIVAAAGDKTVEFPYFTFVQKEGESIMGRRCVERFGGYFPIRFNYDDTYHSSGNMSIQVHPGEDYCREQYNELGRQDESYYIVATGHEARTYAGFKEEADADAFLREAKRSEKEHTPVEYERYVHAVPSAPGTQIMLPAGTIHASGRNQLILEIGSLTVGSYTYKLYDYLRADLDGVPRPIHTHHGERVLEKSRTARYVERQLVQEPRLVRQGDGCAEYIVGEHENLYFSLRRLEFERRIEDDTQGEFHVLALVDGEQVVIESLDRPELRYHQRFLDVVVVPANMGRYAVRNLGNQPVVLHKTRLKDGYDGAG